MRLTPFQIEGFLISRGWVQVGFESLPVNVFAFEHPSFPSRQLFLPRKEDAPDYEEAITLLLGKLSSLEHVSPELLRRAAERSSYDEVSESVDAYSLRILKATDNDDGIPLSTARLCLAESEVLLLSANCQSYTPATSYRRLDNKISNSLLQRVTFNHTRRGSFILSVSCGIASVGEQLSLNLDPNGGTVTRRTFVALSRGVSQLAAVIQENRVREFARDTLNSSSPVVSSNFCESLGNLVSAGSVESLEFSFSWSPLISLPSDMALQRGVSFEPHMAPALYQISTELLPEEEVVTDRFLGTVEALRGDLDSSGTRAGWVEFLLSIDGVRQVRATAFLDASKYKLADEAHIAGAQKVAITGTLEPRPRVWFFKEVMKLELIASD
jgi:hypothetical protein